jgi:hypothetical protein
MLRASASIRCSISFVKHYPEHLSLRGLDYQNAAGPKLLFDGLTTAFIRV